MENGAENGKEEDTQLVPTGDQTGVPSVDLENRRARVWQLRIRGLTTTAISKILGIHVSTVYADLKAIGRQCCEELLKVDPVELVAGNIHWLDELERIALFEIHQATTHKEKVIDNETGETKDVEIQDPNKSRFYMAALQARKMKIDLLVTTGIIPRERASLFEALEGSKSAEQESVAERTDDEIRADIDHLIKHGRTLK